MQEIKVGEIFVHDGRVLIAKEGDLDSCHRCVFYEGMVPVWDCCWKFPCTPSRRHDGKMIYFEEVKDAANN